MVGKTNVGGGEKLFAVIAVTYPEGSTCTCSNGTKTLKARDTSGKALFNVTVGEWTVSCTDGKRTKSVTVSITTDGQVETVKLTYEYLLISEGNEIVTFSNVASGSYPQALSVSKGTDRITLSQVYAKGAQYVTSVKHDLTGYSTLKLRCIKTKNAGQSENVDAWVQFGITNSQNSNWVNGGFIASKSIPNNANEQILTLDISEFTGDYYVSIGIYSWYTVQVFDFWLE